MNIKNNYFITTIALTVAAVAAFEDNANTKALKGEAINNLFLPQVRGSRQLKKEQQELGKMLMTNRQKKMYQEVEKAQKQKKVASKKLVEKKTKLDKSKQKKK